MVLWSRGHNRMASGVSNPAEWFDVKDTPKVLVGIGKRALRIR